jgi:hypothetical protein
MILFHIVITEHALIFVTTFFYFADSSVTWGRPMGRPIRGRERPRIRPGFNLLPSSRSARGSQATEAVKQLPICWLPRRLSLKPAAVCNMKILDTAKPPTHFDIRLYGNDSFSPPCRIQNKTRR